jgi:hypothetical protein
LLIVCASKAVISILSEQKSKYLPNYKSNMPYNNSFNYFSKLLHTSVAGARQNARSDRVCLDFSLVTFFVAMTKKVTMSKIYFILQHLISLLKINYFYINPLIWINKNKA